VSASRRTGNITPSRRIVGAAIGTTEKLFDVNLVCSSCGSEHTVPFSIRQSFAAQERAEECLFCGRAGLLRQRHRLPIRRTA
jgi:hypothetical protein